MSTHKKIKEEISNSLKGKVFFPKDFFKYGSIRAVNMALSRLVSEGFIERIAFGIYLYPKSDNEFGEIYPSIDEIAREIAKRDKARVYPTGAFALYKLGLTTQIPMRVVYLTDGSPRKVSLGKASILFKKAAPKKLLLEGIYSGLIIRALEEIGKDNFNDEIKSKIKPVLAREDRVKLNHDLQLTNEWIRNILISIKTELDDKLVKAR